MSGKFVWVRGLRGPIPEKWPHDMPAGGRVGKTIIKEYDLSATEFALKIAILEQRYPPPRDEPPKEREVDPSPTPPPLKPAPAPAEAS